MRSAWPSVAADKGFTARDTSSRGVATTVGSKEQVSLLNEMVRYVKMDVKFMACSEMHGMPIEAWCSSGAALELNDLVEVANHVRRLLGMGKKVTTASKQGVRCEGMHGVPMEAWCTSSATQPSVRIKDQQGKDDETRNEGM